MVTFDPLADTNLITEYIDARIKKELDHIGVFAQFTRPTSLGSQLGTGPADFLYTRAEKTGRGFTITKTRPGSLTRYGEDAYQATTASVDIYTGGVELPFELTKVQKWEIQEDILEDMVLLATDYYEKALGTYLYDNISATSESVSGSLTFPIDIITGRKTVLSQLKRPADTLIIASNLEDKLLQLDQFIHADKFGNNTPLLAGQIGRIYGMDVVSTPLLNAGELGNSKPSNDVMFFLNRQRPTLKTMYWEPLFRFDQWEVKERHVYTHELRGYFDIYIWDSNAVAKMEI